MLKTTKSAALLLPLLLLTACGGEAAKTDEAAAREKAGEVHVDKAKITLSDAQISTAGIQVVSVVAGGAGAIELPATIEGDPQGMQVVSAAISGRIVALNRNLGQSVGRGETLAVIESREAAQLKGEVEASRARLALARSNLAREERLFMERVSPEQDLIAARTSATEARIGYDQARSQVSAAGGGGGGLNRIGIAAPISGQVIARSVVLGQTVAADAELYRVANLSSVSISLNLQPADAERVRAGNAVVINAAGRQANARVSFVSPVLDAHTKLVPVIAILDNRSAQWRVGEAVTASVQLADEGGSATITVPAAAIQTVEGKPVVFVRTKAGFQVVHVTLGDNAGRSVVVRSGLNGGEQIATTNSFTLKAEVGKGEAAHED